MRSANIIASVFLLLFAAGYAILIYELPTRNLPHTLGAAFFPWVLAGCLAFLSLILLVTAVFSKDDKVRIFISKRDFLGIVGLLILIFFYVQLMKYLGFILDSIIFLALLTWFAGSRKPFEIIIFSITVSVTLFLVFHSLFSVQFPSGIFF